MKNNLKKLAILLTLVFSAIIMVCCGSNVNVTLDKTAVTMVIGDTKTIVATVTGSEESATWSTSNSEVVTVNGGTLTAVAAGTATVTAKVGDKSASAEITVISREAVPTLLLSREELSVKVGGSFTLSGQCISQGQSVESTLSFASSDESIATVDANGVIAGVGKGECEITVTASAMGLEVTATCAVTVVPDVEIKISAAAIDLSLIELVDEDIISYNADAKVWVNGAETATAVTYTSSNNEVFTVDANGLITPVAEGEATLTIDAEVDGDAYSKEIPVTVQRTLCQNFEISMVSAQKGMLLTKEVVGYKTGFDLEIEVAPYSDDMIIEWATTSNIITVVPGSDKRTATVLPVAGSAGGHAAVTVTIEGNVATTQTFEVDVYVPISTEQDFYKINDNKANGYDSFVPAPGGPATIAADAKSQCDGLIPGYYILTNDIVFTNCDPANNGTNNGYTFYKKSVVGRSTSWADLGYVFTGVFDGNGYKISGLRFDIGGAYQALFGANAGVIKNLEIELNPYAWSDAFPNYTLRKISAGISSFNVGTIENCKVVTELNVDNTGGSSYSAGIAYTNGW